MDRAKMIEFLGNKMIYAIAPDMMKYVEQGGADSAQLVLDAFTFAMARVAAVDTSFADLLKKDRFDA
jgi:hypothetical protein